MSVFLVLFVVIPVYGVGFVRTFPAAFKRAEMAHIRDYEVLCPRKYRHEFRAFALFAAALWPFVVAGWMVSSAAQRLEPEMEYERKARLAERERAVEERERHIARLEREAGLR